jgi:hypothetical protein
MNLVDRLFQTWSRVPRDIRDANSVGCLEFLPETLAPLSRVLCRGVRESREGTALAPRYPLQVERAHFHNNDSRGLRRGMNA